MKNPFAQAPARKFPRFCGRCGSPLVSMCEQTGYDEQTGGPNFSRWKRCPRWTGDRYKVLAPDYAQTAAELNETFDARKYTFGSIYDTDYIDCRPAYVPEPTPQPTDC